MTRLISILILIFIFNDARSQSNDDTAWWHGQHREMRYHPEGTDFVITNGKRRFIRALYGTNTAFRVEAGDLPEFALYMPGMGGNFKFGIVNAGKSKWLIDASYIKATYRPGSMLYEIKDPLLGKGIMYITVLALADHEGMIIKTNFKNISNDVSLIWAFGGASGKKFSRDGDVGADPESSFYLQEENCKNNFYKITANGFQLAYNIGRVLTEEERYEIQNRPSPDKPQGGDAKGLKQLRGLMPPASTIKLTDATKQGTPIDLFNSDAIVAPVLTGRIKIRNEESYYLVENPVAISNGDYDSLKIYFTEAENARRAIAERVKVKTPDKYINTIGGALSIAADAIWEDPTYLHGAVAWRMRLNGWRGPYVADPLGWHDRARKHFSSYALSQITTPPATSVVMDTALHLARHLEKVGTALFSDGYICRNPNGDIRPHHYDMNLVFVDELLNHFNWTGDTAYVRQMFPLIKRHLAWEKRNFDADGDGLYDAYAAIWASDALQYSGGGVTHSSAYNYRSNKMAADLARMIGEDGKTYEDEANKIDSAVEKNLWLPYSGTYAEYKDLLGNQLVHPSPALWTIYQAIDSKLPNAFQAYLSLRYVDEKIPHIPVNAKGFNEKGLYLLSTTNWQPYTWSLNNVVLAENLNTALAYWQGDRRDEAYRLWRSAIIESMYMSASPGGFEQLSYYDAIRGELYRDFADPIGVAARSLVEGLFGIQPDALHDTLTIQPGLPTSWNYASIQVPDVLFDFKRSNNIDNYSIQQHFKKQLRLKLVIPAYKDQIEKIMINGVMVKWKIVSGSVGEPKLQIVAPFAHAYRVSVYWKGSALMTRQKIQNGVFLKPLKFSLPGLKLIDVYNPPGTVVPITVEANRVQYPALAGPGTIFVQVKQGAFMWWQPVTLDVNFDLKALSISLDSPYTSTNGYRLAETSSPKMEKIELSNYFNDKITNIFKHQYLSPRPTSPTLQLPTQGIGNWAYPLTMAEIDDSGLRKIAGGNNEIVTTDGTVFATPSDSLKNNIVFTSQWDNFPDSVVIPLSGKASGIYLLLAGTTNPMQSRITNGIVKITYTDSTTSELELNNPESWWPIEQDYYQDGFAFTNGDNSADPPERLYLKEGKFGQEAPSYTSIKGFSNRAIDGGAATVFELYLDKEKTLQSLTIQAVANDVIIGLMAATLTR